MTVSEPSSYNFEESQAASGDDNQSLGREEGCTVKADAESEIARPDEEYDHYEGPDWDDSNCLSSSRDVDSESDTEDYLMKR